MWLPSMSIVINQLGYRADRPDTRANIPYVFHLLTFLEKYVCLPTRMVKAHLNPFLYITLPITLLSEEIKAFYLRS
jgi:hypothetical protein